jgi:exosome complex RNA-binding protein Rrp42 (RNase PH superfamily)
VSLTYGTFENNLLADPSAFEEPLLSSFITVITNEKGEMMSVTQEGLAAVVFSTKDADIDMVGDETSASSRTIERCITGARRRRQELLEVLKF